MKNIFSSILLASFLNITIVYADQSHGQEDDVHQLSHLFSPGTLVSNPSIVDSILSAGTKTRCYAVTVTGTPNDHALGP